METSRLEKLEPLMGGTASDLTWWKLTITRPDLIKWIRTGLLYPKLEAILSPFANRSNVIALRCGVFDAVMNKINEALDGHVRPVCMNSPLIVLFHERPVTTRELVPPSFDKCYISGEPLEGVK